jgi:hypothetical protein
MDRSFTLARGQEIHPYVADPRVVDEKYRFPLNVLLYQAPIELLGHIAKAVNDLPLPGPQFIVIHPDALPWVSKTVEDRLENMGLKLKTSTKVGPYGFWLV